MTIQLDQTNLSSLTHEGPEDPKPSGRPKGTTKMLLHDKKFREKQCLDDITLTYTKKRDELTLLGKMSVMDGFRG